MSFFHILPLKMNNCSDIIRKALNTVHTGGRYGRKRFKLVSDFEPAGDQPKAIDALVQGIEAGLSEQVLLGVTGSGKTYIAQVIERVQKPTLVFA